MPDHGARLGRIVFGIEVHELLMPWESLEEADEKPGEKIAGEKAKEDSARNLEGWVEFRHAIGQLVGGPTEKSERNHEEEKQTDRVLVAVQGVRLDHRVEQVGERLPEIERDE